MKWTESILVPLCFVVSACGSSEGHSDTGNTVLVSNIKPVAKIVDMTPIKAIQTPLKFNGADSSDADGDALTYHWSLVRVIDQKVIPLEQNTGNEIAVSVAEQGNYSLRLYVNDGHEDSTAAQFEFLVPEQAALVADAGRDFTVKKGQVISLSGANSKASNGTISEYHWKILDKPADSSARIFRNQSTKTNFVADAVGTFIVQLSVTDKAGLTAQDSVVITSDAIDVNSPPMAIINVEKSTLAPNEIIRLDGSKSHDPDRLDRLSYRWSVLSAPENSQPVVSKASAKRASFSSNIDGVYDVQLAVTDQHGAQDEVVHQFIVQSENQVPIAVLGSDKVVNLSETVSLSCVSCFDPEGEQLSYEWLLLGAPQSSAAHIVSSQSAVTEFTPDVEGEYLVAVRVSDGLHSTTSNTQMFDVKANQKPIAQIAPISTVALGSQIVLDGTGSSDPEGADLTYEWQVVSQPANEVLDTSVVGKAMLQASHTGTYVFSLKTHDGTQYSDTVTQTVLVTQDRAPVINIHGGDSQSARLGDQVTLDATASYDPEGEALVYQWKLVAPAGSNTVMDDSRTGLLNFTPDIAGLYGVNLTVSDAGGLQTSSTVTVTVTEQMDDLLSGTVKGRVVDTGLNGVPNAVFKINDKLHTAGSDGFYEFPVKVENGAVITLETYDERLVSAKHITTHISQNDFIVNVGESFVPVNQVVDTYIWGCAGYTGPQEVSIKFKMVETFPTMDKFTAQFEKSFLFTVEGNKKISLPATATYEVTTDDNITISPSESTKTIYYAPDFGAVNIINICN